MILLRATDQALCGCEWFLLVIVTLVQVSEVSKFAGFAPDSYQGLGLACCLSAGCKSAYCLTLLQESARLRLYHLVLHVRVLGLVYRVISFHRAHNQ